LIARDDILLGLAEETMTAWEVYQMREEYQIFPFSIFSSNQKAFEI